MLQNSADKYYKFTTTAGETPKTVEWLNSSTDAATLTTDADKKAYFKGVKGGTYRLIEIKAPMSTIFCLLTKAKYEISVVGRQKC